VDSGQIKWTTEKNTQRGRDMKRLHNFTGQVTQLSGMFINNTLKTGWKGDIKTLEYYTPNGEKITVEIGPVTSKKIIYNILWDEIEKHTQSTLEGYGNDNRETKKKKIRR
jgi:hypothetical protein